MKTKRDNGLSNKKQTPPKRPPFEWTEERIQYLLDNDGIITRKDMAKALNIDQSTVFRQFKKMNMTKENRRWTQDEVDYLITTVGVKSIGRMASELKRTNQSVLLKLTRLGIGDTWNQIPDISLNDLQSAFNISIHSVQRWKNELGLPVLKKATRYKRRFYVIKPKDFWKWAKDNQSLIDFRKYESLSIPEEPDWLKEAIRKDYDSIPDRHGKLWTHVEEISLLSLLKSNLSYREIGIKLKRSTRSIQERVVILRKEGKW